MNDETKRPDHFEAPNAEKALRERDERARKAHEDKRADERAAFEKVGRGKDYDELVPGTKPSAA